MTKITFRLDGHLIYQTREYSQANPPVIPQIGSLMEVASKDMESSTHYRVFWVEYQYFYGFGDTIECDSVNVYLRSIYDDGPKS